jgi:tetratricopeptide (TPR) repeat protein
VRITEGIIEAPGPGLLARCEAVGGLVWFNGMARRSNLILVALLAGVSLAGGDPEAAREAYEDAAQAMKEHDYERARASLARSAELDPEDTEALLKLGMLDSRLGLWDESVAAYEQLLERDPGHAEGLNNLGNVHYRQGHYEQATVYYAKAIEVRPDYLLALFHQGRVLRQLNRVEEAEALFARCLELPAEKDAEHRTQLDCLFYAGTLRFRAGDYDEARRTMEQVLAVYPSHAEARYYLAMAYRRLGRTKEAEEQLEIHRKILRAMRSDEPIEKRADP